MTTHEAAIGVFDSGLGGLSVLASMRARLPDESIVYLADSGYAPYGEKTDAFIRQRSKAIAEWLIERGAKMIVVACNTATTHAIGHLRSTFSIPIVGVEPGIKPAAFATASGIVGVLATAATLRSDRLKMLISKHESQCRFVCRAGHGLVEQIEQGNVGGEIVDDLLTRYLTPMADAGADTVILGSTHFPLLIPTIRRLFGDRFTLVETGSAIARRVQTLLDEHGLAARTGTTSHAKYYSTAQTEAQRQALIAIAYTLPMRESELSVSYADIAHAVAEM